MVDDIGAMKVLIVEDQDEVRDMLRSMMVEIGVGHISGASDGRDALAIYKENSHHLDLVVCDWNMPNMNGLEFLQNLREINTDIPFLMLTGRADFDSVVQAKSNGVTAYISKPFTPDQLERKLNSIMQFEGLPVVL